MNSTSIIFLGVGGLIIIALLYATIISFLEKEKKAGLRLFFTTLIILSFYIFTYKFNYAFRDIVIIFLIVVPILTGIILFLPLNFYKTINSIPNTRIDERDTMFSRRELKPHSERFENYYAKHPEKRKSDDKFRKNPGLASEGSLFYDSYQMNVAQSSFATVAALQTQVKGLESSNKIETDSFKNTEFIKKWIKSLGAHSVGITELKDYHLYSHGGRGVRYGKTFSKQHKYAIAFTVEMSKEMMDMAPYGPTLMESAQQYLNSGMMAVQVAEFIRKMGFPAQSHIDANYEVVCPLVARDAGLGELGRMGLLLTPELGPRVRIAVVTTDFPLEIGKNADYRSIIDFCTICKKCADTCPAQAISEDDMVNISGTMRWQISQEKCFNYWTKIGTDCGRCVSVCPYSHPNNSLHNFVRWGLKRSMLFRRFALKMDDLLYDRKPKPCIVKDWMKNEVTT